MHLGGGGGSEAGPAGMSMAYPSAPAALGILRPSSMPLPLQGQHEGCNGSPAALWAPSPPPPLHASSPSPTPSPPSTSPPRATQRRARTAAAARAAQLQRQAARVEEVYGHAAAPEAHLKLQRAVQRAQTVPIQTQPQQQPHSHRQLLLAQQPYPSPPAIHGSSVPIPPLHSLLASSPSPPPSTPFHSGFGALPVATPSGGLWSHGGGYSYGDASPLSCSQSPAGDFGSADSAAVFAARGWPGFQAQSQPQIQVPRRAESREEKQSAYVFGLFEHAQTHAQAQAEYMQQLFLQQQMIMQQHQQQREQEQHPSFAQQALSHASHPPPSGSALFDSLTGLGFGLSGPAPGSAEPHPPVSSDSQVHFSRRTAPKAQLQAHAQAQAQAQGHVAFKRASTAVPASNRSSKRSSLPAAPALHVSGDQNDGRQGEAHLAAWMEGRASSSRPATSHHHHSAAPTQTHGQASARRTRSVQGSFGRQHRSEDWTGATSSPRTPLLPLPGVSSKARHPDFDDPFPLPPRIASSFSSSPGADSTASDDSEGSECDLGFGFARPPATTAAAPGADLDAVHAGPGRSQTRWDESSRWSRADELFIDDLAASFLGSMSLATTGPISSAPAPDTRGGAGAGAGGGGEPSERSRSRIGSASPGGVRLPSSSPPPPRPASSVDSFARRSADLHNRVASLLRHDGSGAVSGGPVAATASGSLAPSKQRPRSTTGNRAGSGPGTGAGMVSGGRSQAENGLAPSRAGSAPRTRTSHAVTTTATQQRPYQQRPHSSTLFSPRSSGSASASPSPPPSSSPCTAAMEAAAILASSSFFSPTSSSPSPSPSSSPTSSRRCRSAGSHPPLAGFGSAHAHAAAAATWPTVAPYTLPETLASHGSLFYARLAPELWGLVLGFLDAPALLTHLARVDRTSARIVHHDHDAWVHVSFAGVRVGTGGTAANASSTGAAGATDSGGGGVGGSSDTALSLRASLHATLTCTRLHSLAARWSQLRSLDLSGVASLVTDSFLARLVSSAGPSVTSHWARGLGTLVLARCTAVTDAGLESLAPSCSSLRSLDLSWAGLVTPRGLDSIVRRCGPSLVRLVLNRCHSLGDGALRVLGARASALQELDLTFCGSVTDAGVAALAHPRSACFFPRSAGAAVQDPELENEDEVDTSSQRAASPAPVPAHPGLRKLCLRWCRLITDESVRLLAAVPESEHHGHSTARATSSIEGDDEEDFERVNVPSPSAFSDGDGSGDGGGAAVRSCALVSLNVDHCSLLSDASLLHLSKGALSLRSLSAIYCPRLTPASMRYLASGPAAQLRTLVLDHCDGLRAFFAASNLPLLRALLLPSPGSGPKLDPAAAVGVAGAGTSDDAERRRRQTQRPHPLVHLRLLSWRTCGHAGIERSRHAEIEAECCNGLAGSGSGAAHALDDDDDGDRGTRGGASPNNVLEWIRAAPSISSGSGTPRFSSSSLSSSTARPEPALFRSSGGSVRGSRS